MLARRRDRSLDRTARAKTAGEGFLTKGKAGANSPDYHCSTITEEGAHESISNVEEGNLHSCPPRNELCEMLPALLPEAHFRNPQGKHISKCLENIAFWLPGLDSNQRPFD
jgi:hypothetical protein